jgi:rhodanese-related sulfurtransferase
MTMIDEVTSGSAQLLDVRTSDEWEKSHAEYALHIPVSELLHGEIGLLLPTKKIYVYCAAGGRASTATSYLQEHGFQAECVGGLNDWMHATNSKAKE